MNLLANAIDALEAGIEPGKPSQASLQIHITTAVAAENQIVIKIADTGPGMTAAVQQQVFQPFFTTKPMGKGTGLGLSISHQVITEAHNGVLKCHSSPGQGTEFLIQIPSTQA